MRFIFFSVLALLIREAINPAFSETFAPDPWSFPFRAAQVVFDPGRPLAYLSDPGGHKVIAVNLEDGTQEKELGFNQICYSLALSPDGHHLYVGLLEQPFQFVWSDPFGHVAEVDLGTWEVKRQFRVNVDPFNLVATEGGYLLVTGGSGQWTGIWSHKLSTGEPLNSVSMYMGAQLSSHPERNVLYASVSGVSPSDIHRLELNPSTGELVLAGKSPYHGHHPMGGYVFVLPDGRRLVTRAGGVYTSAEKLEDDMLHLQDLEVDWLEALVFDPRRNLLVAPGNWKLSFLDAETLELLVQYSFPTEVQFAGIFEEKVITVSVEFERTVMYSRKFPARTPEENAPPRVQLDQPLSGQIFHLGVQSLELAASAEDEDGAITQVAFFSGEEEIHTVYEPPYQFTWHDVPSGVHRITAVATDNLGAKAVSEEAEIRVNLLPAIQFIRPGFLSQHLASKPLILEVEASDPDGEIREVQFYQEQIHLGTVTAPPFLLAVPDLAPGTHRFRAVAIDDLGASSFSFAQTDLVGFQGGSADQEFASAGCNLPIHALVVQEDGKILLGGSFTTYQQYTRRHLARVLPNGDLDFSFDPGQGTGGWVWSLALQPDGKIVVGGPGLNRKSFTAW